MRAIAILLLLVIVAMTLAGCGNTCTITQAGEGNYANCDQAQRDMDYNYMGDMPPMFGCMISLLALVGCFFIGAVLLSMLGGGDGF